MLPCNCNSAMQGNTPPLLAPSVSPVLAFFVPKAHCSCGLAVLPRDPTGYERESTGVACPSGCCKGDGEFTAVNTAWSSLSK